MCKLVEGVPHFELRKGLVYIADSPGAPPERAMLLGDFVESVRVTSKLARQWVAEANKADRVCALKGVEAG